MESRKVKIAGIGACVMDTLITIPFYPKEDTKLRTADIRAAGGGPVATGLVAAAKLGVQSGYLGILSDDTGGSFLLQDFEKYGVDTGNIQVREGYRSFTSTIWLAAETATRTCVFDKGTLPPYQLNESAKQTIAEAQILMIDGNEMEAACEGCRIARENGTKVLYDCGGLYPNVERLLKLTDVMIPSAEFAVGHTGKPTIEEAAKQLYAMYHPEIVIVTDGKAGGIRYDGSKLEHYPAFLVEAVDTNGSGDVFHGAFAAAMGNGLSYADCCLFASAVSALKCTGVGARESVPDLETVKRFLKERGCKIEV